MVDKSELTDPCENCLNRIEDDWGLVCDLSCGKATQYTVVQATLKAVKLWLESKCTNHTTTMVYSTPMKRDCGFCLNELCKSLLRGEMPE